MKKTCKAVCVWKSLYDKKNHIRISSTPDKMAAVTTRPDLRENLSFPQASVVMEIYEEDFGGKHS